MSHEEINNEVLFWQRLIQWWQVNHDEPVPHRMYLALELAEALNEDVDQKPEADRVLH